MYASVVSRWDGRAVCSLEAPDVLLCVASSRAHSVACAATMTSHTLICFSLPAAMQHGARQRVWDCGDTGADAVPLAAVGKVIHASHVCGRYAEGLSVRATLLPFGR